ncbi:MAG: cellulase family glycosylhydrolase [Opitutaceae bacterium]|jgi:hypothetical protein
MPHRSSQPFLPSGGFRVGCNYWASHAGTHTWSDWRPEIVSADFSQLADARLTLLRIFPLWPDFQPLQRLATGNGDLLEYRLGEEPLPDTPAGQAGVDAVMLERLRALADLAHARGLQLIVGLVTGWMSGRLFTPPAFANVNVITDPEAIKWQVRLVRCIVDSLRNHPAIVAWDLGNECNCMGRASAAEAWTWTHAIATAIRAADPSRPVISGMHSLQASAHKPWAIRDQAELTDFLTTHPYPLWTPHCDLDAPNTLRPQLHATTESRLYADLGGKPCFAEEMGSMGPFIVSDALTPQFLRPSLFSLWAQDCRAMLWWCAYDQEHLAHAPYDWIPVERELGLIRNSREEKPAVATVREFSALIDRLPFASLPPRQIDAICILTEDQDQWAVAQNAFALAKLAGADLAFQMGDAPLRDAPAYLLPSIAGTKFLSRRRWLELLSRVEAGATLYLSLDTAVLAGLEPWAGVEVQTRSQRTGPDEMIFSDDQQRLPVTGTFNLALRATRAEVLASTADGNPVFTRCALGCGQVFLLTNPLERALADTPGAYSPKSPHAESWRIYARIFASVPSDRAWIKTHALLSITEHPLDGNQRVLVLINHNTAAVTEPVRLKSGWNLKSVLHGPALGKNGVHIPACDGAILLLTRTISA